MKLSCYSIFSDKLNERNDRVIFSNRTAQSAVITGSAFDKINKALYNQLSDDLLNRLIEIEALVEDDVDEFQFIIEDNKNNIKNSKGNLYLVIQPTANCQLGCDYCGQTHSDDILSTDLVDRIIAKVKEKLALNNYYGLSIGWFGGEPLLGLTQIRSLTDEFLKITSDLDISYSSSIVTNGLSLKENIFLELVNDLKVSHIEVTLDGISEFHDKVRYTKKKKKTFDIILENLESILNREDFFSYNCPISVRCNVDYRNVQGVSLLIKLLAEKKLHQKIDRFYPIGIYSWGGNDANNNSLTKEEFAQLEIQWLIEMLDLGYRPNFMPNRVKNVCMAVSESAEMYDAFGNIFGCTEVSYSEIYGDEYVLGNLNINDGHNSKKKTFSDWNDKILNKEYQCFSCEMLPVCGGICPKSWKEGNNACPPMKYNVKERLALAYVLVCSEEYQNLGNDDAIVKCK